MDYKAGKLYRLRRRTDIDSVFACGISARDRLATLVARANSLPFSRMGVGISKRHGNAVQRNRIKRLCREAMRLSRPELPAGWDYMLLPKAGARLTLASLRKSVLVLGGRVALAGAAGRGGQAQP
jgi:ribonuclease P protein component